MPLSDKQLTRARDLLKQCRTLADADKALRTLTPILPRPFRWGMWDAWSGRECSTAGLEMGTEEGRRRAALDYDEGFKVGRQLLRDAERTLA